MIDKINIFLYFKLKFNLVNFCLQKIEMQGESFMKLRLIIFYNLLFLNSLIICMNLSKSNTEETKNQSDKQFQTNIGRELEHIVLNLLLEEKNLDDMINEINQLKNKRQKLIQELRQKTFYLNNLKIEYCIKTNKTSKISRYNNDLLILAITNSQLKNYEQ